MAATVRYDYSPIYAAGDKYYQAYGSVTPAKARKSWGDILKIGNKSKKEQSSVIPGHPHGNPYQYTTVPYPPNNYPYNQGPPSHYAQPVYMQPNTNHMNEFQPQSSRSGKGTVRGNTVKYTDWFGSVAVRRPPQRPAIPSFGVHQAPIYQAPTYDAIPQVQQAPQIVAFAVPPGICACPTNSSGTTRAKKKKKCKMCGQKTINIRQTLATHSKNFRPALSTAVYAAPTQNIAPSPQPYPMNGWDINPYAVPHKPPSLSHHPQYIPPPTQPPPPVPEHGPSSDEEEINSWSPETVRSMKSNGSTITLTKELYEYMPSKNRNKFNSYNPTKSGKKDTVSIISEESPNAYSLMEKVNNNPIESDSDDLSDNAVHDPPSSSSLSSTPEDDQPTSAAFKRFQNSRTRGRRVSIISIGEESVNSMASSSIKVSTDDSHVELNNLKPKVNNTNTSHKIRIGDANSKVIVNNLHDQELIYVPDQGKDIGNDVDLCTKIDSNLKKKLSRSDSVNSIRISGDNILMMYSIKDDDLDDNSVKDSNGEVTNSQTLPENEQNNSDNHVSSVKLNVDSFQPKMNKFSSFVDDVIPEEDETDLDETLKNEDFENQRIGISTITNGNTTDDKSRFHASLSELLQVKSILKRPNSVETSSENDSDICTTPVSSAKNNFSKQSSIRSRKSVQFSAEDCVTLVEPTTTSNKRRKKINSRQSSKYDVKEKSDLFSDLSDVFSKKFPSNGDAYPEQNGDAFSKQNGDAYSEQNGDAYSEQNGDTYSEQNGDTYSEQNGVTYSEQNGDTYSTHNGDVYPTQYSDIDYAYDASVNKKTPIVSNKQFVPISLRNNPLTLQNHKQRQSSSAIPVSTTSIRNGIPNRKESQTFGYVKPRSLENLLTDNKKIDVQLTNDAEYNYRNSKYDSNWDRMIANHNSEINREELRFSKLPTQIRTKTNKKQEPATFRQSPENRTGAQSSPFSDSLQYKTDSLSGERRLAAKNSHENYRIKQDDKPGKFSENETMKPLRPARKAPSFKKNRPNTSPVRPSVPPPPPPKTPLIPCQEQEEPLPPPPPPPPSEHDTLPPSNDLPLPLPPSMEAQSYAQKSRNSKNEFQYEEEYGSYSSSSTPSYSPPHSPPPPLPDTLPPPLTSNNPMFYQVPPSSQSFSSFKGSSPYAPSVPIVPSAPHLPLKRQSYEKLSPRKELTTSASTNPVSMFSVDDENKTATIRGRMKPSRLPLTLNLAKNISTDNSRQTFKASDAKSVRRQSNPNLSSFDPLMMKPRSLSPDDPSEHIYEELGSIASTPSSSGHYKLHRLGGHASSHYTSQPNLNAADMSPIYYDTPAYPNETEDNKSNTKIKARQAYTLPPGLGKSIFDGATKGEILDILKNAKKRMSSNEEEEETARTSGDFSLMDKEKLDEDTFESSFRHQSIRSSNISSNSDSSENSILIRTDKERLVTGEVERTDSGVGSETSKPSKLTLHTNQLNNHKPLTKVTRVSGKKATTDAPTNGLLLQSFGGLKDPEVPLCEDCEAPVETRVTSSGVVYAPLVCRRCSRRRQERREILSEIIETEMKYGRDLKIIIDQFYRPTQVAGLLTNHQLENIFLNVPQLYTVSLNFSEQLQDAFDIALESGDEDLLTINVAKFFLQADTMMEAFEYYCIRQGDASLLLQSLEKEKELLRIFLKVSQMENTLLRRMDLHSFLMVPVQRVTKYPLLLARLIKATPTNQSARKECREAKEALEKRLHRMNNDARDSSSSKLWRRISMTVGNTNALRAVWSPNSYPQSPDFSAKIHALVNDTLEWPQGVVVREGKLQLLPPDTNNWTRRGRTTKSVPVLFLLVTQRQANANIDVDIPEDSLVTPRDLQVEEAAIIAFKWPARPSKHGLYKEPWLLSRCIVSWDSEESEYFEVTDLLTRDTYYFKDRDTNSTQDWFRLVQFHAVSVGAWKKRRPAMPNIMINTANRS